MHSTTQWLRMVRAPLNSVFKANLLSPHGWLKGGTACMLQVLEDGIKRPVDSVFEWLSEEPIAAASLGQMCDGKSVHVLCREAMAVFVWLSKKPIAAAYLGLARSEVAMHSEEAIAAAFLCLARATGLHLSKEVQERAKKAPKITFWDVGAKWACDQDVARKCTGMITGGVGLTVKACTR
eukprot:1155635-Pelagomonas_calceolata.AAC.10